MIQSKQLKSLHEVVTEAQTLLDLTEPVDFIKIAQHDPHEVGKLHSAIYELEQLLDTSSDNPTSCHEKEQTLVTDNLKQQPSIAETTVPKSEENRQQEKDIYQNLNCNKIDQPKNMTRRQRTNLALQNAGLQTRIGKYFNAYKNSIEPLTQIPHLMGLPSFDLCISPDHSPTKCNHCIFITDSGVISATISKPVEKSEWKIIHSEPYGTTEEMVTLIAQYITKNNEY